MKKEEILNKLSELEEQNSNLKNQLLYLAADFDNYKKNNIKNIDIANKYKNKDILLELINIIDDFSLALSEEYKEGYDIIYKKILNVLNQYECKPIEVEIGQPFDEKIMDAISITPTMVNSLDLTVSKVIKTGYIYKGIVLRHSTVIVYKKN